MLYEKNSNFALIFRNKQVKINQPEISREFLITLTLFAGTSRQYFLVNDFLRKKIDNVYGNEMLDFDHARTETFYVKRKNAR